jgi:curli production assembly/transport component CsgG
MWSTADMGGWRAICALLTSAVLAGCATVATEQLSEGLLPPVLNPITELNQSLRDLPPPSSRVVVAVYGYTDQTGQMKPSETTQTLSKAVTQGATSVLIKALQDTGNGGWFTVVERERLDNLLKERRIIQEMRKTYLGEENLNPKALPALLFAGILLEGGIIGFDSNLQTGGVGAHLLGIGGDVKYQLNTVTIYLRAVSTKTGQVLASVTTHKTIASIGIHGGVFRYIAVDKILEAEAGFTRNEPDQLAIQQAIEKAVYALVMEGADQNLWRFSDTIAQSRLLEQYRTQQFASPEAAQAYADSVKANTVQLAANEAKAKAVAVAQQEATKPDAEKAASAQGAAGTKAAAVDNGGGQPTPGGPGQGARQSPAAGNSVQPASPSAGKSGSAQPAAQPARSGAAAPAPDKVTELSGASSAWRAPVVSIETIYGQAVNSQ